jgi:hypothetical protein
MRVKTSSAVGDAHPEQFEQLPQDRQSLALLAKNRVSANVDHRAFHWVEDAYRRRLANEPS